MNYLGSPGQWRYPFLDLINRCIAISLVGVLDDQYLWEIKNECLKLKLLNWGIWEELPQNFLLAKATPKPIGSLGEGAEEQVLTTVG